MLNLKKSKYSAGVIYQLKIKMLRAKPFDSFLKLKGLEVVRSPWLRAQFFPGWGMSPPSHPLSRLLGREK